MLRRLVFLLLSVSGLCPAGALRAGAASVDITPATDAALLMGGYGARTQGHTGTHDNIFVRAIVLDDGATQVALVAWELISVPDAVWADVSQKIASELAIRPENLLLAAVHNHGAAILGSTPANTAEYTAKVKAAAVDAVRRAKARLQPARFGIGTGAAYLNMNRRELFGRPPIRGHDGKADCVPDQLRGSRCRDGPGEQANYRRPGRRDLAVCRTALSPRLKLRPEEKSDDEGPVALWTSGAAGDQNPISMASGDDFTLVDAFGKVLGEEVVRVAGSIKTSAQARLGGAQKVVTCPGRQVEAGPRPRADYKFTDADPVNIRLGVVMIDKIPLAGVSGEVFTLIHQHLQKESPFPNTIMVTHANGSSGYIPNDAGFDQISYEVTTSHLKPGCAENAIVNGFMDMLRSYR
jgi:hypothetical protein